MRQLLTPLLYLKIKQPQKRLYEFVYPFFGASVFCGIIFAFDRQQTMLHGHDGIIILARNFLQILAAFFIAALAAISAFTSPIMDKSFDGVAPTLKAKRFGPDQEILSRRRYLALMFGYLSFATIGLYLLLAAVPFANKITWSIFEAGNKGVEIISWVMVFVLAASFMNILVTTFLGLHFLSERIHRPTQEPRDNS